MTQRFVSGFNAFVPQATGQVISFIRDPAKYRINNYAQLIKTPKPIGIYYSLHEDDSVRINNDAEYTWEDGADRPSGEQNKQRFDTVEFKTYRRNYGFKLGWKAIETADWKVLVAHTAIARNLCMIGRTQRVITLLETASNWSGNTSDANTLNGGAGKWDTASGDRNSPNYLAIKKTLDAAAIQIQLKTNGMIDFETETLKLLLSPNLALKMSQTSEIHDYLAQSPFAKAQVTGKVAGQNAKYGLPDQLYGWDIEIEGAVRVSERAKASGAKASTTAGSPIPRRFIKGDDNAVVLSRPGGLDGNYGAPSFSTLQIYYYGQEVEMETFDEPKHRRTDGHVTEDVKEVLAAPQSGFLITDVLT